MSVLKDKRYAISEVSEELGVSPRILRRWEDLFPQLKPKRNRANRRYYTLADIDVARRVKYYVCHDKMTTEGARRRLAEELHGEGRPKTRKEALDLIDTIETEARAILDMLDSAESKDSE